MGRRGSTVGALAQALLTVETRMRAVEKDVTDFLDSLFPSSASRLGWQGWQFDRSEPSALGIQVYDVLTPSPAAVGALHRAGFVVVTIHNHEAARYLSCACIPQIARRAT